MIPEETCARTSVVAFELHFDPECPMQDVCSSCLHASDTDSMGLFLVMLRVAFLFHNKLPMLNLDIAGFELGVQPDVVVVGVLLEVVEHPVVSESSCFLVSKDVRNIWILGEILEQTMSVDFSCPGHCIATRTVVDGLDDRQSSKDNWDKCRAKHVVYWCYGSPQKWYKVWGGWPRICARKHVASHHERSCPLHKTRQDQSWCIAGEGASKPLFRNSIWLVPSLRAHFVLRRFDVC